MANTDIVNGAIPVRHADGSNFNGATRMYLLPAADATATFVGDFVKVGGTAGAAGLTVNGINCEGMGTIAQAAAGDTLLGAVVAILPNFDSLGTKHRLASTARIALVCDAPDVVYEMQDDSIGAALAAIDVGENADIIVAAGSTSTGLSGMEIDSSTHTTLTAQLRILGLVNRPNNAIGTNAKWEVMINEHQFKTTTGV